MLRETKNFLGVFGIPFGYESIARMEPASDDDRNVRIADHTSAIRPQLSDMPILMGVDTVEIVLPEVVTRRARI